MQQLLNPFNPGGDNLPAPVPKEPLSGTYTEMPATARPQAKAEPDTNLLEYWRILRRRKATLILIAAVGAILGFLITLPQTAIYQVRTSLEIVGLNQNFLNVKEADPLNEGGSMVDATDIQTQIKILQSESLIQRVLVKLHSEEDPPDRPASAHSWRGLLNLPGPRIVSPREQAVEYAKKNFKVRASGQTRIIEVTVDSISPQVAAAFANTLTNEFIDQNIESRWKTTERTGVWLTRQLDDIRIRLEQSEDRLQAYARQANLVFTEDAKNNVSEEKLLEVQQAVSTAQTDRITKQSRWEMSNSSPPGALPDILNDPTLRDYQTKLTDLNRQLADLRATFTADEPKVKRLQLQVTAVQTAFERAREDILRRIKNEYDEAVRRESLLTAEYTAQRSVVTGEGDKAVQYNILKREVESNRQLYDAMLQQMKQASLASALRASNIRVVDPAQVHKKHKPYKPDVPLSAFLGLLSGFLMGSAFVIMEERADRSIQSPGETAFFLNLPELGIVPADQTGVRVRVRLGNGRRSSDFDREASNPHVAGRSGVEMVTWQRKPSIIAESFRATLVSILFSGETGNHPKVMVITSANPSDGKSTVVSNLGIAIAEVNQKTLLIDADLRKPRLHDIFSLTNDRGLSDLLRTPDPVAALENSPIQETRVPNLYVLTSGSKTNAATSLLYSNRMPELLSKLRTQFETILIDTPPMLQIPDARVLGRMVDRVILVVRAGKTTRDAATAARQRFFEDGTPMLGTILNQWNPKRSPNGYYGYQDNYYSGPKGYHKYGLEGSKA
jgi:capsular exopolysaccharide synthesis family protein